MNRSRNLWKRKTRISLYFRIFGILLFVLPFYVISVVFTNNDTKSTFNNRKLLGLSTKLIVENDNLTTGLLEDEIFNCTPAAIFEFPSDGLTKEQRTHGWIIIHIVLACYCFWMLAIICDEYFVPAIDTLCDKLKMKEDVAGATFMAAATSSPELFINCVGTFITEGDIGIGTVVGSAVFNVLAVPACCGLITGQIINLNWWSVSRDSFMYGFSVIALIIILQDGRVMWYEAACLVSAYLIYILVMAFNDKAKRLFKICFKGNIRRFRGVRPFQEVTEIAPLLSKTFNHSETDVEQNNVVLEKKTLNEKPSQCLNPEEIEYATDPWSCDSSYYSFVMKWPIIFILWLIIPDCKKYPKYYMITFLLCVILIGATSYFVAFLITVIGDTVNIPDSVMGLTFLAAGTSVPEAVSSIIVTNQGHGLMGISNSIGSNTFDILLCLGLPWLIKSLTSPIVAGEPWVTINSSGITYSAISLLSTLFGLYFSLYLNKFKLDWKIGLTCTFMYISFLIFASLVELNFFFIVNLPTCDH